MTETNQPDPGPYDDSNCPYVFPDGAGCVRIIGHDAYSEHWRRDEAIGWEDAESPSEATTAPPELVQPPGDHQDTTEPTRAPDGYCETRDGMRYPYWLGEVVLAADSGFEKFKIPTPAEDGE